MKRLAALALLFVFGCGESDPVQPKSRGDFTITVEFDCETDLARAGVLRSNGDGTFDLEMSQTITVSESSHSWTFKNERGIAWWGFAVQKGFDRRCYFNTRDLRGTTEVGQCSQATAAACEELEQ